MVFNSWMRPVHTTEISNLPSISFWVLAQSKGSDGTLHLRYVHVDVKAVANLMIGYENAGPADVA